MSYIYRYLPELVSIYNVEKYLKECLESVVNQTLNDIEIICIDDGSTDSSPSILKEYQNNDERFIIINQENSGPGAARNRGIKEAKGKYTYFLDSDDYVSTKLYQNLQKKQYFFQ